MAYTFLKTCFGMEIGKSLFDKKGAELAPGLLEKAKKKGCNIVLPCDWACGQDFKNDQPIKMVTQEEGIPDGWEGMDCGPESMAKFRETVLASSTVMKRHSVNAAYQAIVPSSSAADAAEDPVPEPTASDLYGVPEGDASEEVWTEE